MTFVDVSIDGDKLDGATAVTALRGWTNAQGLKHRFDVRVDEHPLDGGVRVTIFTTATGQLRANFVDLSQEALEATDVSGACANVQEGIISLLCQLSPPRDGGAFTQDDAIKLFGGGRARICRR